MNKMNRWKGTIAVVTGASSGIGLAIAKSLIREGMIVVGLARRKEKMEEEMRAVEGKERFHALKCDVSSEGDVHNAFCWIKKNLGTVQVLVNNAGMLVPGSLVDTSRKDWEKVFSVNVMGLLECTRQAVKMMKEADVEGHIIDINSIEGHSVHFFGDLRFNVYAGTKHAVTGLAKTLHLELLGGKIRVTSISPGYVKTDIVSFLDNKSDTSQFPGLEAEDIADSVLYVLGTPQRVQIHELIIKPNGEP